MNILNRFNIQTYNIGITNKSILDNGIMVGDITWLKHHYKDRFFADPFLLSQDNTYYYVLVEEMCFFEEYGRIVLLKIDKENFSLKEKKTVIEKPFHLSFPFCEEGGSYIVPEAATSGECIRYNIDLETFEVLSEELIVNTGLIDPVIFDWKNESYIFATHKENPSGELFLYTWDDISKTYFLATDDAVVTGRSGSRSAGRVFKYGNKLFRPTQDCTERYGRSTRVKEILYMGKTSIKERDAWIFSADDNPPFSETLHTFNVYDDIILVDGSVDIFSLWNGINRIRKLLRRIIRIKE
jgi:hypothetical protein